MERFNPNDKEQLYEMLERAKSNDREAYRILFAQFKGLICSIINKGRFFVQGGDREDLIQEGMIGLSKAIRDFDPSFNKKFESFARMCIERQLISAIKTATRKKNSPLNEYISFDRTLPDNNNLSMMDILGAKEDITFMLNFDYLTPEQQLLLNETKEIIQGIIEKELSTNEKKIYYSSLENNSYKEIMEDLDIDNAKTIDNGIQRMRKKFVKIKEMYMEEINGIEE